VRKRLHGTHVKKGKNKKDLAALRPVRVAVSTFGFWTVVAAAAL
jgi:hypothetical protein